MKNYDIISDIELYDKSIYKYLLEEFSRVVYAPTDRAMYTLTKNHPEYKDKIPFPFISMYRDPSIPIDHNRFSNKAVRGHFIKNVTVGTDNDKIKSQYVHSLPVTLSYQVDVWGTKSSEVLSLSQRLLVKLTMREPVLIVPINPDGEDGRFHLLDVNLTDNSDLENEENSGRLYRHTFNFSINAWIKNVEEVLIGLWECPEVVVVDDINIYND